MAHIIECKINAKERIYRVDDTVAAKVDARRQNPSKNLSPVVSIGGESVPIDCIMLISPELVWWEHDTRALTARSKQRCQYCFTVTSFGESCDCPHSRINRAGLMNQSQPTETRHMTTEEHRRAMARACSIALLAPSATLKHIFVAHFLRRYNINAWELPEPSFADVARASAIHEGKSKTLQEWRDMVAATKPATKTEPDAQNEAALGFDGASAVQEPSQAVADEPAPFYDPTGELNLHDEEEDVDDAAREQALRERELADIPF